MTPFFAATIAVRHDADPEQSTLYRIFATDAKTWVNCMFADGSTERRWVESGKPPKGCDIGPGQWALINVLATLWAAGLTGEVAMVQPGSVGQTEMDAALAFVAERMPQWTEYTED